MLHGLRRSNREATVIRDGLEADQGLLDARLNPAQDLRFEQHLVYVKNFHTGYSSSCWGDLRDVLQDEPDISSADGNRPRTALEAVCRNPTL